MKNLAARDVTLRPHLLRALYDWCAEKRYTPYLVATTTREDVQVPPSAMGAAGSVILNISPDAVRDLTIGDIISFTARFQGSTFHVFIPVGAVTGLYARETGSGFSFPALTKEEEECKTPQLMPQKTSQKTQQEEAESFLQIV